MRQRTCSGSSFATLARPATTRCGARGGKTEKIQIKGRCVLPDSKPGQRVGSIKLDKPWDTALLVILDADLEAVAIHEASRADVEEALTAPGSRARNERGALAVSKFKSIGRRVWPR